MNGDYNLTESEQFWCSQVAVVEQGGKVLPLDPGVSIPLPGTVERKLFEVAVLFQSGAIAAAVCARDALMLTLKERAKDDR